MTEAPTIDDRETGGVSEEADLTYLLAEDEEASVTIVRAVASRTETSVLDLEPLYDVLDPDNVNALCRITDDESPIESASLTFSYGGCTVTVTQAAVHVWGPEEGP